MATHSSILAWEIPWKSNLGITVHGFSRIRGDLVTKRLLSTYPVCFPDSRDTATTSPLHPPQHHPPLCQALKHILTPSTPPLKVHAHRLQETESQEDHHTTGSAISLPPGQIWVPLEPACAMLLYGKSLQSLREASTLKGWRKWDT